MEEEHPHQPFRDPVYITELLSDSNKYNVLFVFSHGELVASNTEGSFDPDENNILISTGADTPGEPVWVSNELDQDWINLFDPSQIKRTFGILIGLHPGLPELAYKVPGDVPQSSEYALHYSEEDSEEGKGIWGVYKHNGQDYRGNGKPNFHNVVKDEELSERLKEGILASSIVDEINAKYTGKVNIVLFISCRTAFRGTHTKVKQFTHSAAPLFAATHFHTKAAPSGLNEHMPTNDFADKPLRVVMKNRFDMTVHLRDLNFLLQELVDAINTKHDMGITGLYILPHINGRERLVFLENEALFGGQLRQEYLQKEKEKRKGDGYVLEVYPSFGKQGNAARRKSKKRVHPTSLETAEIQRRSLLYKKGKGTRKKQRKTKN